MNTNIDLKDVINIAIGVAQTVAVIGSTAFAFKSVKLGRENIAEMRKLKQPKLVVFIRQSKDSLNIDNLVLKNEGETSAIDISFKIIGQNIPVLLDRKISEVGIIKNGMSLLSSNEEVIQPLTVCFGKELENLKKSNCRIQVSYKGLDDNSYQDIFKLDFKGLVDVQVGESIAKKASKILEDIQDDLHEISNNLKSIANKGIVPPEYYRDYPDESHKITSELGKRGRHSI